ncbi:MAG: hypothetical protein WCU00_07975 [Candidatus Latescibacterota bacterium]
MGTRYLDANEVKQDHIDKLGDKLGPLFHELLNEVTWLYMKWEEYVELFGKKPSRIDLLNQSAPLFFRMIQDSLWENILLHIARITDPPKSTGKENLTIQILISHVKEDIKEKVSKQIDIAMKKSEFCRDWRNRHIAHCDLNLALGKKAEPLKQASRAMVKDALESIASVVNTISEYYCDSSLSFGLSASPGGAVDLLYIINDGIKADNDRKERIKSRNYLPEDLIHPDL